MQELSLHVLDIAQNSVSAGATKIEVTIEEHPNTDQLVLIIEDDGCGMTGEQISKVTDPFYTTRTTRKVGLGLSLLKMAAEQSGGSLSIISRPGAGTRVKAVLGLSHIDRMPVGDIAQTMAALIQCNPELDFIFVCRSPEKEFTADTREMRHILGEVPLSEPRVILYISEMIREHTAQILKD